MAIGPPVRGTGRPPRTLAQVNGVSSPPRSGDRNDLAFLDRYFRRGSLFFDQARAIAHRVGDNRQVERRAEIHCDLSARPDELRAVNILPILDDVHPDATRSIVLETNLVPR